MSVLGLLFWFFLCILAHISMCMKWYRQFCAKEPDPVRSFNKHCLQDAGVFGIIALLIYLAGARGFAYCMAAISFIYLLTLLFFPVKRRLGLHLHRKRIVKRQQQYQRKRRKRQ